jgi:hypothetical protein
MALGPSLYYLLNGWDTNNFYVWVGLFVKGISLKFGLIDRKSLSNLILCLYLIKPSDDENQT